MIMLLVENRRFILVRILVCFSSSSFLLMNFFTFILAAITIGVRILGPAGGFILGSFCTRLYVNPNENPGFSTNDPQWVGAWWLGES